ALALVLLADGAGVVRGEVAAAQARPGRAVTVALTFTLTGQVVGRCGQGDGRGVDVLTRHRDRDGHRGRHGHELRNRSVVHRRAVIRGGAVVDGARLVARGGVVGGGGVVGDRAVIHGRVVVHVR